MKLKIVKVITQNVQAVADAEDGFYYGVKHMDGYKGFISRDRFNSGHFKVLSSEKVTRGNNHPAWSNEDLKCLLLSILNHNDKHEVFQFDTSKELFTWLAS